MIANGFDIQGQILFFYGMGALLAVPPKGEAGSGRAGIDLSWFVMICHDFCIVILLFS